MKLQIDVKNHNFVVVAHYAQSGELIWIGSTRMALAFDMRRASNSYTWRNAVEEAGGQVTVELMGVFETNAQAAKHASTLRQTMKPMSWDVRPRRRSVRCLDTGEQYRSASDAAEAHQISKGAMSSHLNGYKNYETVHGKRFEWVDTPSMVHALEVLKNGVPPAAPVQIPQSPAPIMVPDVPASINKPDADAWKPARWDAEKGGWV